MSEPGGLPSRSTKVPIPSQLLGLLPPPPEAGWPSEFQLQRIAARLREQYERQNEAYVDLGKDGEVRNHSEQAMRPDATARDCRARHGLSSNPITISAFSHPELAISYSAPLIIAAYPCLRSESSRTCRWTISSPRGGVRSG